MPADHLNRPESTITPEQLLRAAAHNHRSWFRRHARHAHGAIERVGRADLMIERRNGTVPFSGGISDVEGVVTRIRKARLRQVSWWSLRPDNRLGASLVARGFGWGWEPHWMARALDELPNDPPIEVSATAATGPFADDLPYAPRGTDPPRDPLTRRARGRPHGRSCDGQPVARNRRDLFDGGRGVLSPARLRSGADDRGVPGSRLSAAAPTLC